MDDKRTSTLEVLDSFIQTQRFLLQQTQEDIAKLQKLKSYVLSQQGVEPEDLLHQMDEVGPVNDPAHYRLAIPKELDWDVFSGCDPAPLHALTLSVQEKLALSARPSPTQASPLSDLQTLVKQSKKGIVDPVLEQCAAYTAQISLEDEDEESEKVGDKQPKEYWKIEMDREREREKIRELKKRKIHAGLSLPGMTTVVRGGVFVRRDVEDESAVVDVTAPEDGTGSGTSAEKAKEMELVEPFVKDEAEDMDVDLNFPSMEAGGDIVHARSRPVRARRATVKQQILREEERASSKKRKRTGTTVAPTLGSSTPASAVAATASPDVLQNLPMDINSNDDEDVYANPPAPIPTNGKRSAHGSGASTNKPKSETYKQAWTESEQNLLEQLLEKIPDGEKNRWKMISRAMNGRRTPRQVASRVQKYFEKLKKYGIDISKSGGGGGSRVG